MIAVFNLATGDILWFSGCLRPEAVIAAYAQSRNDNCTWQYTKYQKVLREGKKTYSCGDFATIKLSFLPKNKRG